MLGMVGVAPGTTTITLPDGSTIALADWIDDRLYGSIQLVNAQTTPVEAFSSSRSQVIPGGARVQTRVDTNVPRSGDNGLPKDWEMLIFGIAIKMVRVERGPGGGTNQPVLADGVGGPPASLSDPATLRTLFNVDRTTFFAFEYNSKIYSSGVIQHYPQGHGYSVFSTNAAFEIAQNGIPSPRDRLAMVLPIHMRENLGYKGIFQPEAPLGISQAPSDGAVAPAGTLQFADLRVDLNGLIKRTVV